MKKNIKKILLCILLFLIPISNTLWNDYNYDTSQDIKLNLDISENWELEWLIWNINWQKIDKNKFTYFKISFSENDPNIRYPYDLSWYTDDINKTSINIKEISNYKNSREWENFFRLCLVMNNNDIICNPKSITYVNHNSTNQAITDKLWEIKTFLRDNYKILDYIEINQELREILKISTFDKEKLSIILSKYSNKDYEWFEKTINLIKSDLKINKELDQYSNINLKDTETINKYKYEIDNKIDLINRSIDHIWKYNLNTETLNELIKIQNTLKGNDYSRLDNYKSDLTNKINDLRNEISIDLDSYRENLWTMSDKSIIEMENSLSSINKDISQKIKDKKEILSNDKTSEEENKSIEEEINNLEKSQNEINELIKQIDELKKSQSEINKSNINLTIIIILLIITLSIFFYKYQKVRKFKKIKNNTVEKTLQILKSWNEYSVEYNWIYNKWIKVLENNKNNITESIESFVKSMNKLTKNRWANILEELNNLDIDIPNLEESWSTIYRLFLPDNIRKELEKQNGNLIIKTDEQEIPWELMHDWNIFLSLKFPIARQIMTREHIRENNKTINKKAKILFIVNPTWDLPWTESEVNKIISKLWNKADITVIKWNNTNSLKIFSMLWKDYWDIIHYSWHAYFNRENPDESWLVLENNQIITSNEIKRSLNWNPLIFLNACSSGKTINEEEDFKETWEDTIGLASSFIIWWAKWVVSTMWPVNDKAAEKFAIDFYSDFIKWKMIWQCILEAKQNSFSNNTKNITWASFIYYWDPKITIDLK